MDPATAAVPAAQSWQLPMVEAPSAVPLVPAGQFWHVTDPGDTEKFPATQETHVLDVAAPTVMELQHMRCKRWPQWKL